MLSLKQQLEQGLKQQAQDIDPVMQEKLLQFIALLTKWNKIYNLTSIRKPQEMLKLHLLDSLVIESFLTGQQSGKEQAVKYVLDAGTGGGIPGIPLAICLPHIDFVLLDARIKKIRFIQTAIAQLGLKNVKAVHSRVEDYLADSAEQIDDSNKFDRIISRAFASLEDMLMFCQHLCRREGRFLAMKGQIPEQEIAQLPKGFKIAEINKLEVAGLNAQRHLIQIVFE